MIIPCIMIIFVANNTLPISNKGAEIYPQYSEYFKVLSLSRPKFTIPETNTLSKRNCFAHWEINHGL